MKRKDLINHLTQIIENYQKDSPLLIGISGVEASGKTFLAKELSNQINRAIYASIDDFHNPKNIRHAKGEDSPAGYYFDSFNYDAIIKQLLEPLTSGNLQYTTGIFDYLTNSAVVKPIQSASRDSILIMEGIFLFRPELVQYWDLKIFVDTDFKVTLKRVIERSTERQYHGTQEQILHKYKQRYIPGQKLYFKHANPKQKADIIIDNNDYENPLIIKG